MLSQLKGILQAMIIAFIMNSHIIEWSTTVSSEVQSFIDGMSHGQSVRAYVNGFASMSETARGRTHDKRDFDLTATHRVVFCFRQLSVCGYRFQCARSAKTMLLVGMKKHICRTR